MLCGVSRFAGGWEEYSPPSTCCIWPAVIAAGAAIASSAMQASSAKRQQEDSQEFAREQMAFQERMSSTAHQRQVDDLRAAGLNPILSTRLGGASTPSGSMGTAVDTFGPAAQTAAAGAVSAMKIGNELEQQEANVKNTDSDTVLKRSQTYGSEMAADKAKADTALVNEQAKTEKVKQATMMEELDVASANALKARLDKDHYGTDAGREMRRFGNWRREAGDVGGFTGKFAEDLREGTSNLVDNYLVPGYRSSAESLRRWFGTRRLPGGGISVPLPK